MKSWSTIRRIAHAGLMLYVVSILFAFSIVIVACAGDPILTVLTMPFGIGLGALNAWRADRYVREDRRMLSVLCGVIPPLVVASCFTFAFGITYDELNPLKAVAVYASYTIGLAATTVIYRK